MFNNVAPVEPELALAAIEKSLSKSTHQTLSRYAHYAETLRDCIRRRHLRASCNVALEDI